jgi:hypothetical protein
MPLYYLHLEGCGEFVRDPDGREFADLDAARAQALKAAREVMCAEVAEGRLWLNSRINIAAADGTIVSTVQFRDAVAISGL